MALDDNDIARIKLVVNEVVDTRVEPRFDEIVIGTAQQFERVNEQLDAINDRLSDLGEDVAVVKDIVKDHSFRIARLEHKFGGI